MKKRPAQRKQKIQKSGSLLTLLGFVFGSIIVGSIGSLVTYPAIPTWYLYLQKPPFSPPNWLFGPVWTLLFTLMGIAAYLVFKEGLKKPQVKAALRMFAIQFVFNVAWSFAFFGARSPSLGLMVILILWFLIVFTLILFKRVNSLAGYLLMPYFLWVSFAMVLNAAVYSLNG
jgi:benzodiazapine receptor